MCLLYLQAREQPLTASQTIRTGATLQAKVTKSLLDSPHDELMENNKVKLPTIAMQLGNKGGRPNELNIGRLTQQLSRRAG